jgi:Flp pilus assembly protein TadB
MSAKPLKDTAYLHARRRQARRRRHLLRVDMGLGIVVALVALLVSPGLAVIGAAALAVLAICVVSILFERWRSRRRRLNEAGRPGTARITRRGS